MGADDELDVIHVAELRGHVGAKHEDTLALPVGGPVARTAAGIGPEEVDDHARVGLPLLLGARCVVDCTLVAGRRELGIPVHSPDLRQRAGLRIDGHRILGVVRLARQPHAGPRARQAGVHDQDLVVDEVEQREVAERLREEVEEVQVVLAAALPSEAVDDVGLEHLVVPAVEEHRLGVLQLERKERQDDLDGPRAAVDEVAVEQEGPLRRRLPGHGEDIAQIEILAMQVAEDRECLASSQGHIHQCCLLLEQIYDVKDHHVGVPLGQIAATLLERDQLVEPGIVDAAGS
mmetsp:Transcript_57314/g.170524  ORF Transcript_57314/g.170524 Transcript_57314/m.170524 type:complete len:290 (+) Transcript_57314:546-1415(+)